jgi:hypothetical protein
LFIERKDETGKNHQVRKQGTHIINALNGRLLSMTTDKGLQSLIRPFFGRNNVLGNLEFDSDLENNQINKDLVGIKPNFNCKISSIGDYSVNIVDDKISEKSAEKTVLEKVIADNIVKINYKVKTSEGRYGSHAKFEEKEMKMVPRHSDVEIEKKSLIYILNG